MLIMNVHVQDIDEDSTSLDGLTEDADDDEPEPEPEPGPVPLPERVLPSFCGESTLEGIRPLIKVNINMYHNLKPE